MLYKLFRNLGKNRKPLSLFYELSTSFLEFRTPDTLDRTINWGEREGLPWVLHGLAWPWYSSQTITNQKKIPGLPWWRSGWDSACQCRGHGFVPRSGKIPHAAEQLGLWATTAEPARLEPELRNNGGHDSERPAHRDEEWPPLAATRERPRTETKTQHRLK